MTTQAVSSLTAPRPVTPVGILAARLEDLVRRVTDLQTEVGRVDGDDLTQLSIDLAEAHELCAGLDPALSRWTTPESSALRDLADRTAAHDWSSATGPGLEQEMLSGHVEGQLLKMLVHATRARRVLEIGMFTGYSALAMAEALPDDGVVVACEIDPDVAFLATEAFARSFAGARIEVLVGPADQTLSVLASEGEQFDLVFIDADKAGYEGYLSTLLETTLLTDGGLICVDNTLMQGQPWTSAPSTPNGVAIAAFNDAVAADPRVEQVVIPLRDGLTLVRRVNPVVGQGD